MMCTQVRCCVWHATLLYLIIVRIQTNIRTFVFQVKAILFHGTKRNVTHVVNIKFISKYELSAQVRRKRCCAGRVVASAFGSPSFLVTSSSHVHKSFTDHSTTASFQLWLASPGMKVCMSSLFSGPLLVMTLRSGLSRPVRGISCQS